MIRKTISCICQFSGQAKQWVVINCVILVAASHPAEKRFLFPHGPADKLTFEAIIEVRQPINTVLCDAVTFGGNFGNLCPFALQESAVALPGHELGNVLNCGSVQPVDAVVIGKLQRMDMCAAFLRVLLL